MLPNAYCESCINKFVGYPLKIMLKRHTSLDEFKITQGTCDECGKEGKLYELPFEVGDFFDLSTKLYLRCHHCGKNLKTSGFTDAEGGLTVLIIPHSCES